jgi:enoyl-CoA hydratase
MSGYQVEGGIAHLTLDHGKVNALGSAALGWLHESLDQALADGATAVVLTGREGVLCAGFDLKELQSDPTTRESLRRGLINLELRLFEFELPVVIACTGHAMAAGAALLLSADRRIGLNGDFKIGFNEAKMGVAISAATVELARYRMPMPWFESLIAGETYLPAAAVPAGLLDVVVDDASALAEEALRAAEALSQIASHTFQDMRRVTRGATADRIRLERARLWPDAE